MSDGSALLVVLYFTLTNGFKETHERVVLLLEVKAETAKVFERWLSDLQAASTSSGSSLQTGQDSTVTHTIYIRDTPFTSATITAGLCSMQHLRIENDD